MNKEDRAKEKERLWNEVFSKKRSVPEEPTVLMGHDEAFDRLKGILQHQQDDLEQMQKEIQKDYGVTIKPTYDFDELASFLKDTTVQKEEVIEQIVQQFQYAKKFQLPRHHFVLSGAKGVGKHYLIQQIQKYFVNKQWSIHSQPHILDLSRYQSATQEQMFLQDLYVILNQNPQILVIEGYLHTDRLFLKMVEQMCLTGQIDLNKRYVMKNGIWVENQTGLDAHSLSQLNVTIPYFIFVHDGSKNRFDEVFSTPFVGQTEGHVEIVGIDEKQMQAVLHDQFQKWLIQDRFMAMDGVEAELLKHVDKTQYFNGIRELLEQLKKQYRQIQLTGPDTYQLQSKPLAFVGKNVFPLTLEVENDLSSIQMELDQMVGLTHVKEVVQEFTAHMMISKRRRQMGLKENPISLHMIFTGNPGTGKTTIARIVGKYMKQLGMLSKGNLVEVTRKDLVAQYAGQTAPKTMEVIQSAIGGILFIDEAYALYRGQQDSFGLECIDMLVKAMEDYRDELVVILAGYEKEMATFLESNSGLSSRFATKLHFEDYLPEELLKITTIMVKKMNYVLEDGVEQKLLAYYQDAYDQKQTSGNGRFVRNLVEKATLAQAKRLLSEEGDLQLLKEADFQMFNQDK